MGEVATAQIRIDADSIRLVKELAKTEAAAKRSLGKIQKNTRNLSAGFNQVRAAVGVLAGALGTRELVRYSDQFQTIQNRLKLVTQGTKDLAAATEQVFNIAQRTRSSFGDTAELYSRLSLNTRDLNLSQKELLQLTESISQAAAVSGATQVEQSNAVRQLTQALASGIVRAEEYNSIIEQTPRIAQAIADGLGKTVGELRGLVVSGQLTAEDVLGAFAGQAGKINEEFQKLQPTVEQSFTTLRNSAVRAFGEPISQVLGPLFGDLAKQIQASLDTVEFKDSVSASVFTLARGLGVAADALRVIDIGFKQAGVAGQAFGTAAAYGVSIAIDALVLIPRIILRIIELAAEAQKVFASALGMDALANEFEKTRSAMEGGRREAESWGRALRDEASGVFETAKAGQIDIATLLSQPLPSTGVEAALKRIKDGAEEASTAVASVRPQAAVINSPDVGSIIAQAQEAAARRTELARQSQEEIRRIVLDGERQISTGLQSIIEARAQTQVAIERKKAEDIAAAQGKTADFDVEKALAQARIKLANESADALIAARQKVIEGGPLALPSQDADTILAQTQGIARDTIAAWSIANQQRLELQEQLNASLFESDFNAGQRLAELAQEQAAERVRLELEARNVALDEAGVPIDADERVAAAQREQDHFTEILKDGLSERASLTAKYAQAEIKLNQESGKRKVALAESVAGLLSTIANGLATENKAVALAALAVDKGLAAAQVIVNTQAAIATVSAQLGIYAGPAIAALQAQQAISLATIGAASLFSAAGTLGGGGSSSLGSGGFSAPSPQPFSEDQYASESDEGNGNGPTAVQIFFEGPVLADDATTKQFIEDVIREAVDERDVVIINGRSRQAQEIRES